ncbi:SDR family NAD(P)-dependent oxidoreductase [Ancylobacter defluvii]|uniref:Short-chain dehydrogenase n=1 Tax=Ancylobacter defluvii TaxID=1282440 RepID=A0A9W6JUP3_9HYPH|nr:SDR family NAD(P)-dependent oxidoreductase [Ancylobacter defluvii]MBS7587620.1 SDR family NAD(P)-dependent oxidoreductase [Ancylobacter defluvii]GLK82430.1 short-chain dehydrogenase [Ancylobacter defluvii]
MTHPAIAPERVAVVTGGASGIGLAAARRFGAAGMAVLIMDLPGPSLTQAVEALRAEGINAVAAPTDVTDIAQIAAAKAQADRMGPVSVLMCNAGREGGGGFAAGEAVWRRTLETNFWGVFHGLQAFLPDMIGSPHPGAVVMTGSKQGITLPPGDTAYNVSKAALRALAESVSHDLVKQTGGRVSAHLLIPGFVYTGFTRAKGVTEKPAGAWTPDQTADFMMDGLDKRDFYILCPDNEVTREMDLKRMRWGMGDIIENRPALSRWHPDYAEAFAAYMKAED